MLAKIVTSFLCFGLMSGVPVPQRESEEGYALQEPAEIPQGIFPNRDVPTVPFAPDQKDIDQLYNTPRSIQIPGTFYKTPKKGGGLYSEPQTQDDYFPGKESSEVFIPPVDERFHYSHSLDNSPKSDHAKGMPYDFRWEVNDEESNNVYNHIESSDGVVTTGQYKVLLPDGRLQVVTFMDRGNGYEAVVSYEDFVKLR